MWVCAGKLRSADCVAEGRVQVVVINKKDFMDLDNPLLAWMLDSDAVTTVLRVHMLISLFKSDTLGPSKSQSGMMYQYACFFWLHDSNAYVLVST